MADDLHLLEKEFCPPIDPALVHAIYSDFAGTPDGIEQARGLLEDLKKAALDEQWSDFDPSGSSGDTTRSSPGKESDEATSSPGTTVTECTNLSNDFSTLSLGGRSESEGSSDGGYFRDTERFDTPTKELLLAETFPTLRPDFVAYTLKKCNNNFSKATDELLNHVYFEDSRASPTEEAVAVKGVDAFAEEFHVPHRKKKGKGKRKQRASSLLYEINSPSPSDSDAPALPANKWLDSNRDVEFITSRTKLSSNAIASLYHRNGASRPATIMAILEKDVTANQKEKEPDATIVQAAIQLTSDFPSIDLDYAIALIRISAPSTANAHELAKGLTVRPGTTSRINGAINVIPQYAPVNLFDSTSESTRLPSLPPSALPRTTTSLAAARGEAFNQASAAYRKGKSTPMMKAVAGYYSQVGRDINANLKAMNETDADALVTSQSSARHLDLHGVSVQSAVRISKERVQAWWSGLGEERIPGGGRKGVGEGYRIITGLGRHSEGGRAKIGPAVVRALVKEGWKIEVGTGELLVVGLARRR
ncbi:hypothetical protein K505DRAFT_315072 [Melanomma pulvis-pyrius CBS 109.77]|uniref:Smr domain-containing protein n=1 Tax=Melanomma pulvis-pyrius CBS 109.77 TaxID=1314802 RepID=A0A6A6WWL5_9PLEO|nr:hypothetical protein K505DRAFT_315072 [Melanomma pulvis-pyrius CBS 109.77]